jgi:hypothetical protein
MASPRDAIFLPSRLRRWWATWLAAEVGRDLPFRMADQWVAGIVVALVRRQVECVRRDTRNFSPHNSQTFEPVFTSSKGESRSLAGTAAAFSVNADQSPFTSISDSRYCFDVLNHRSRTTLARHGSRNVLTPRLPTIRHCSLGGHLAHAFFHLSPVHNRDRPRGDVLTNFQDRLRLA